MKKMLAALPLFLASQSAWSFDWAPVVSIGVQKGGDDVAQVYDAESGQQIESVKLGGFYAIEAGVRLYDFSAPVEFQFHIGDIFDYVEPTIGDHQTGKARVDRMLVEGLVFWRNGKLRLGGGAAYHYNPGSNLELDTGEEFDIDFESELALVLQADYWLSESFNFAIKGTMVDYTVKRSTDPRAEEGDEMGASALGVRLMYNF